MAEIETVVPYELTDYEEAAYMLSKYFIERNFDADTRKSREHKGGYVSVISRTGFLKNLLGSRTALTVTFFPYYEELQPPAQKNDEDSFKKKSVALATEKLESVKLEQESSALIKHNLEQGQVTQVKKVTGIEIKNGVIQDGVFKEALTYLLVIPALRKLSDNIRLMSLAKTRSLVVCEKLKKTNENV